MCMGVDGEVWTFSEPVGVNDLVILTTDGLTDNVSAHELPVTIPLIVRARFFDVTPTAGCQTTMGPEAHLPTLAEITELVGDNLDELASITCFQAAQRLLNYIVWVTKRMHDQEEQFYAAELRRRELAAAATPEARQEMETVTQLLGELRVKRKLGTAGKTDDAIVMVMEPFHRHASSQQKHR